MASDTSQKESKEAVLFTSFKKEYLKLKIPLNTKDKTNDTIETFLSQVDNLIHEYELKYNQLNNTSTMTKDLVNTASKMKTSEIENLMNTIENEAKETVVVNQSQISDNSDPKTLENYLHLDSKIREQIIKPVS